MTIDKQYANHTYYNDPDHPNAPAILTDRDAAPNIHNAATRFTNDLTNFTHLTNNPQPPNLGNQTHRNNIRHHLNAMLTHLDSMEEYDNESITLAMNQTTS